MARQLGARVFGERSGTVFGVAQFPVEGRKFRAQIDDAQIHEVAAGGATAILGGVHQEPADSGALQARDLPIAAPGKRDRRPAPRTHNRSRHRLPPSE